MSTALLERDGVVIRARLDRGTSIAVTLDFDGPQPHAFGAPPAAREALAGGGFVGDTLRGGSCNVSVARLVAHCNGTHTEGVGHVVDDPHPVGSLAMDPLVPAALVTVTPTAARDSSEGEGRTEPNDLLVTAAALRGAMSSFPRGILCAVVIRTSPNDPAKPSRDWDASGAPYLTGAAAALLADAGVEHLVVDLPSLDRMDDGGRLAAHRAFFGLPDGSRALADCARPRATVTELAYAPDALPDGLYALSLQVAPWASDAAPSRPILYPAEVA